MPAVSIHAIASCLAATLLLSGGVASGLPKRHRTVSTHKGNVGQETTGLPHWGGYRHAKLPVLKQFKRKQLRAIDKFVHKLLETRKAKLQLVGSTLALSIAAEARGTRPRGEDVDMRLAGVTVDDVMTAARIALPGFDRDRHVTRKPPFKRGVQHVQIDVDGVQLDMGIYTDEAFAKPHQNLTIAQLMLDVGAHAPLSRQLVDISSRQGAQAAISEGKLHDPSGKGVEDLFSNTLRYHRLKNAPASSVNEAFLHALYWIGKPGAWRIANGTLQQFESLDKSRLQRYFKDSKLASRRIGYILSAFRANKPRRPSRVLELFANAGTLGKVFAGMNAVIENPARWRATMRAVEHAFRSVRTQKDTKGPPKLTREWVVGAILSQLEPEKMEAALKELHPHRRITADYRINVKQRIRTAYRFYHDRDLGQ